MGNKFKIINLGGKIIFFLFFTFFIILLYSYNNNLKPMLNELGSSRASYIGQNVINKAVENVFSKNDALENDILTTEKDKDGKITAVIPDLKKINNLKSKIAVEISEQMKRTENSKITVPVGNLTGIPYFSNLGPRITFNLIPYGKTRIDFKTTFTEAGINQIRHEICVEIELNVSLLIGEKQTASTKITTSIPVAETIIIGEVPDTYTNFVTDDENKRDDAVNMLD